MDVLGFPGIPGEVDDEAYGDLLLPIPEHLDRRVGIRDRGDLGGGHEEHDVGREPEATGDPAGAVARIGDNDVGQPRLG